LLRKPEKSAEWTIGVILVSNAGLGKQQAAIIDKIIKGKKTEKIYPPSTPRVYYGSKFKNS